METEYFVIVDNLPIEGTFTRSEAIKKAKELNGTFRDVNTDVTASKRRSFRLSDSDMYKLYVVAQKEYNTDNKAEALRAMIYEKYKKNQV